jgi:hypothetical protein
MWTETGLEDLEWWHQHNSKMLKRIIKLSLETCKNPTKGIGKPEPFSSHLIEQGLVHWLAIKAFESGNLTLGRGNK